MHLPVVFLVGHNVVLSVCTSHATDKAPCTPRHSKARIQLIVFNSVWKGRASDTERLSSLMLALDRAEDACLASCPYEHKH